MFVETIVEQKIRTFLDLHILYLFIPVLLWLAGDHCDQLFVVQGGLSQQSELFHDAADRGAVFTRSPCGRHHSAILGYQTTAKGAAVKSLCFFSIIIAL